MHRPTDRAVILDDIRSVHNVGSVFRTADALGVGKIFLCGVTPAPIDRFGRARRDLAKVALGAEKTVPWAAMPSAADAIRELKQAGFRVIAVEQDARAVPLASIRTGGKTALVLGSETAGIGPDALAHADAIAEIPMHGAKESLNVSVAFGIAGYAVFGS